MIAILLYCKDFCSYSGMHYNPFLLEKFRLIEPRRHVRGASRRDRTRRNKEEDG
jgi:hypothetical protein